MSAAPNGQPITMGAGLKLQVPNNPIIPFIEGDGTGRDIWRASVRVFDAAVEKAYKGEKKIAWHEVLAGEKAFKQTKQLASGRDGRGLPQVPRRYQGPADDADRRRHPLAERRASPAPRPLRLPPPRPLVPGRAEPGQAPGRCRHGDLPREHRGHLHGHRVGGRLPRGEEGPRLHREGVPEGLQEDPLPGHGGHRREAGLERGHRAPRPRGDRLRHREQAEERHDRAQGQHHEVHRRCVHEVGLCPRRQGVRGQGLHLGDLGEDQGSQGRGRGERGAEGGARVRQDPREGTRSRTSRSSRSSRAPRSSTSSRR